MIYEIISILLPIALIILSYNMIHKLRNYLSEEDETMIINNISYLKINHDNSDSVFKIIYLPDDSHEFLSSCYEELQCNSIEIVSTTIKDIILIIDEEGKCYDGWENRINIVASFLYGSKNDPIVGDAILARKKGVDIVPLTDDDIEKLIDILKIFQSLLKQ